MLSEALDGPACRAEVWGSPIAHSLSPVLHRAAYAELGLPHWSYGRRDVTRQQFPAALAELDSTWRGLSLTMPLKEVALAAAVRATEVAHRTGAANTLVRERDGWVGHNTDVDGIVGALAEVGCTTGQTAIVVGSGATARSAVSALRLLGVAEVAFMVRAQVRPETAAQARAEGMGTTVLAMGQWQPCDLVVSTVSAEHVPLGGFEPACSGAGGAPTVLDAVYGAGPSSLGLAGQRAGGRFVDGTRMLLHQAARQVQLMTGQDAPLAAMSTALEQALAKRVADGG